MTWKNIGSTVHYEVWLLRISLVHFVTTKQNNLSVKLNGTVLHLKPEWKASALLWQNGQINLYALLRTMSNF